MRTLLTMAILWYSKKKKYRALMCIFPFLWDLPFSWIEMTRHQMISKRESFFGCYNYETSIDFIFQSQIKFRGQYSNRSDCRSLIGALKLRPISIESISNFFRSSRGDCGIYPNDWCTLSIHKKNTTWSRNWSALLLLQICEKTSLPPSEHLLDTALRLYVNNRSHTL